MTDIDQPSDARAVFGVRHADRSLVLAQQLTAWVTHAHELDEEVALANLALDLLGQARLLYTLVAEIDGRGLSEDDYAYRRSDRQFCNPLLVEQPNGDFANTMMRQFLHDAYAMELWSRLSTSSDSRIAAVAGKAVKETAYHLRHSTTWVVRLGDGTPESHRRSQAALDRLWRYTGELFEVDDVSRKLSDAGVAPDPGTLRPPWDDRVGAVLADAGLATPPTKFMATGGWSGLHGEGLGQMLGEMQVLQRSHPGVSW